MYKFLQSTEHDKVVFVDDVKGLESLKNLSSKKLYIIVTDFKDINSIKKFCKDHSDIEVWTASKEISRKNVLAANACGIKNVVKYPVDNKLIQNYFKKKDIVYNPAEIPMPMGTMRGVKVMIVDDNQMNIDLLVDTLEPLELDITTHLKPLEAGKAVEQQKYDLFLLDVMMPEMSGFDLASKIKNTKINSNALIIFISALSDSENKITGYNLGSYAYIEKPFDINVVRSQIYNVLKTKQLQDALKDKKETFLAMVTHDLKTPIYAEICALELLLNEQKNSLSGMQQEIINDILAAAKYMKNLVENLMQKYKFDNENIVLHKENYSLKGLVSECIEETKYLLEDKNLHIKFKCGLKNSVVPLDNIELRRVINNLIVNAVEYSKKMSTIVLNLSEDKDRFIFSISNETMHFSMDNPEDIFQQNVSYAYKHRKLGTGLGLYISKKIIEAHGGTISAEKSDDSIKITFTIPK